jgi:hypothetical protein
MDDDGVWGDLDDIERLLPPHTTEYRSRAVLGVTLPAATPSVYPVYEEPATVPDLSRPVLTSD